MLGDYSAIHFALHLVSGWNSLLPVYLVSCYPKLISLKKIEKQKSIVVKIEYMKMKKTYSWAPALHEIIRFAAPLGERKDLLSPIIDYVGEKGTKCPWVLSFHTFLQF